MSRDTYSSTSVPVGRSQDELRDLLRQFGADQFSFGEGRDWVGVEFVHSNVLVRLRTPLRPYSSEASSSIQKKTHLKRLTADDWPAHESRRVWRVLVWNVKARLVAVEEGLETFEQAFLAHLVDPATDRTIWQSVREEVESGALALGAGGLPKSGVLALGRGA